MASDLKDTKVEKVKIKFEKLKKASTVEHRVRWSTLYSPWKDRDGKNRLESSWRTFQRVLNGSKKPFEVEKIQVGPGSGEKEVPWHVWDDATKLSNPQVEHYSVMRAEEKFIKQGYAKTASKYFCIITRKRKGKKIYIPSENSGIDNFFEQGSKFVVCESKFTRDEGFFGECKADPKKAWGRLSYYKKLRQMSWQWIADRAGKAARNPAGMRKADAGEKKAIRAEVNAMRDAIEDRDGIERYLNIYGASQVPVLPGTYLFRSATNHKTVNQLNLRWTLDLESGEFIKLEKDFDDWCAENGPED